MFSPTMCGKCAMCGALGVLNPNRRLQHHLNLLEYLLVLLQFLEKEKHSLREEDPIPLDDSLTLQDIEQNHQAEDRSLRGGYTIIPLGEVQTPPPPPDEGQIPLREGPILLRDLSSPEILLRETRVDLLKTTTPISTAPPSAVATKTVLLLGEAAPPLLKERHRPPLPPPPLSSLRQAVPLPPPLHLPTLLALSPTSIDREGGQEVKAPLDGLLVGHPRPHHHRKLQHLLLRPLQCLLLQRHPSIIKCSEDYAMLISNPRVRPLVSQKRTTDTSW